MIIDKNDELKLDYLMKSVYGCDKYDVVRRMSGMTNHTYQVKTSEHNFVVRIPGQGTEELISRENEKISTELACSIGIDAKLLYFGLDGCKITEMIPDAVTMTEETLKDPDNIRLVSKVMKTLHSCGVDTGVRFDVFEMAADYENIIAKNNVSLYEDYESIKADIFRIRNEISNNIANVPCHNDPLCANWVKSGDRMYLIDWEYAGMNDAMWDLADVSIECGYSYFEDEKMLECYFGRPADTLEKNRFEANKLYLDYLWTLWGKARVPFEGQPMEDYAYSRYERLKKNLAEYKKTK